MTEEQSVAFAATSEGYALPVIDVTDPRFTIAKDAGSLEKLRREFLRSERIRRFFPRFLMNRMLISAAGKSRLLAALFASDRSYLDSISTYAMKLGPDNLVTPFDSTVDRRFAGSPHATYLRLRMQQVAELLAEGLAGEMCARRDAPLHLVSIAGGPAIDCLNALIILARSGHLDRPAMIHVLDIEPSGAVFGRNALSAMKARERPLSGFDIQFEFQEYDWNQPATLDALVKSLSPERAVIAASSEGGLFEYGSDAAIVANLSILGERGVRLVAGSVTRNDDARRRMVAASRFKLVLRGIEGFLPLASEAGFSVAAVRSTALSDQVLMHPA